VHERTGKGAQGTFSLVRRGTCDTKFLKQRLLCIDDASGFGDLIRKQGYFGFLRLFLDMRARFDLPSHP
jgi:hypothetical protein